MMHRRHCEARGDRARGFEPLAPPGRLGHPNAWDTLNTVRKFSTVRPGPSTGGGKEGRVGPGASPTLSSSKGPRPREPKCSLMHRLGRVVNLRWSSCAAVYAKEGHFPVIPPGLLQSRPPLCVKADQQDIPRHFRD